MRYIIAIMAAAVLGGCSTTYYKSADGQEFESRNFLTKRQLAEAHLGEHVYVKGYRSKGEAESIAPLIQGFVELATIRAIPQVPEQPQVVVVTQVVEKAVEPPVVEPPVAEPEPEEPAGENVVSLPDADWLVVYTVNGLVQDPGRAGDGGWEHVFGDLRGEGFDRVFLMNMGGGRNMRLFFDDDPESWRSWHDGQDLDQPADGIAEVAWERSGNDISVSINGKLWHKHTLSGTPKSLVVGGSKDTRRSFSGEVLDFAMVP